MDWSFEALTASFFDQAGIERRVASARLRVLSRFGAFARRRAQTSIRKRKKPSPPGQPPSSHEGSLRRLILFALDRSAELVAVGPVLFRRGEAPRLLEHAGDVTRGGKRRHYRGNAFVEPAAEAERPGFEESLHNMVR